MKTRQRQLLQHLRRASVETEGRLLLLPAQGALLLVPELALQEQEQRGPDLLLCLHPLPLQADLALQLPLPLPLQVGYLPAPAPAQQWRLQGRL